MANCKILQRLDLCGSYLTFRKYGNQKNKTTLGGIVTIITSIIFISLLYNFSVDIIFGYNPTIIVENLYQPDNAQINLASKDLFFGFTMCKIEGPNSITRQRDFDERIFKISITLYTTTLIDHYKTVTTKELGYRRCKESDIHENARESFQKNYLDDAFCIDNKDVKIYGQFESQVVQYVRILIKKCEGEHCLPDNQISEELSKLRIAFYYTYGIETLKKENEDYNINLKIFDAAMSLGLFKRFDLFFSENYIKDDFNLFFKSSDKFSKETKINSFDYKNYEVEQNYGENINFFGVYLRASHNTINYYRYYKKIPTALSEVMAVMKYMFFLVHIFLNMVNFDIFSYGVIQSYLDFNEERGGFDETNNNVSININMPVQNNSTMSLISTRPVEASKKRIPRWFLILRRIICCKRPKWEANRLLLDKTEELLNIYNYIEMIQDYKKVVASYSELINLNKGTMPDGISRTQYLERIIYERVERKNSNRYNNNYNSYIN
jgi:hypothetical protein